MSHESWFEILPVPLGFIRSVIPARLLLFSLLVYTVSSRSSPLRSSFSSSSRDGVVESHSFLEVRNSTSDVTPSHWVLTNHPTYLHSALHGCFVLHRRCRVQDTSTCYQHDWLCRAGITSHGGPHLPVLRRLLLRMGSSPLGLRRRYLPQPDQTLRSRRRLSVSMALQFRHL